MKKATFKEYEEAKKEILYGREFKENTSIENNVIYKIYACNDGNAFYERTEGSRTEFWSTKDSESRIYEEISKRYSHDEQLAILIGNLNGTLDTYKETGEEHLKDKAIGFIILAEALNIIDQKTMIEIFGTIKKW